MTSLKGENKTIKRNKYEGIESHSLKGVVIGKCVQHSWWITDLVLPHEDPGICILTWHTELTSVSTAQAQSKGFLSNLTTVWKHKHSKWKFHISLYSLQLLNSYRNLHHSTCNLITMDWLRRYLHSLWKTLSNCSDCSRNSRLLLTVRLQEVSGSIY